MEEDDLENQYCDEMIKLFKEYSINFESLNVYIPRSPFDLYSFEIEIVIRKSDITNLNETINKIGNALVLYKDCKIENATYFCNHNYTTHCNNCYCDSFEFVYRITI